MRSSGEANSIHSCVPFTPITTSLIQLPVNTAAEALATDPSSWVPATAIGDAQSVWAPGFGLAQL